MRDRLGSLVNEHRETAMPQDLQARLDKLLADAADCEIICNLATDVRKRASFARLASEYKAMAEALRAEIAARHRGHRIVIGGQDGPIPTNKDTQSNKI